MNNVSCLRSHLWLKFSYLIVRASREVKSGDVVSLLLSQLCLKSQERIIILRLFWNVNGWVGTALLRKLNFVLFWNIYKVGLLSFYSINIIRSFWHILICIFIYVYYTYTYYTYICVKICKITISPVPDLPGKSEESTFQILNWHSKRKQQVRAKYNIYYILVCIYTIYTYQMRTTGEIHDLYIMIW